MKKLTEQQAWLTAAEAYAIPRGKRTAQQGEITITGICNAIETLELDGLLELGKSTAMIRNQILSDDAIIRRPLPSGYIGYFCSWENPANDLLRADFCYMQYYMLGGK